MHKNNTLTHTITHTSTHTGSDWHPSRHTQAHKSREKRWKFMTFSFFFYGPQQSVSICDMRSIGPQVWGGVESGVGGWRYVAAAQLVCVCVPVCVRVWLGVCARCQFNQMLHTSMDSDSEGCRARVRVCERERGICVCVWLGSVLRCVHARATCVCLSVCRCCPIGAQKPFCQQQQQ